MIINIILKVRPESARAEGIEPSLAVLETAVLPLNDARKFTANYISEVEVCHYRVEVKVMRIGRSSCRVILLEELHPVIQACKWRLACY